MGHIPPGQGDRVPLRQEDHIPLGTGGSHPSGLEWLPFPGSAELSHRVPAGMGEARGWECLCPE